MTAKELLDKIFEDSPLVFEDDPLSEMSLEDWEAGKMELINQFKSEICKAQRENCTNSINPDEVNGIKHRVNVYNTPEP